MVFTYIQKDSWQSTGLLPSYKIRVKIHSLCLLVLFMIGKATYKKICIQKPGEHISSNKTSPYFLFTWTYDKEE